MTKIKYAAWALTIVALFAGCVWAAEQVTVARNHIDVLKGPGSLYLPPIATAQKGQTLDVLDHQGRWLKVHFQDADGYVLAAARNAPDSSGGAGAAAASAGGSTEATAAAAAKGWDDTTWSNNHNLNRDGLNTMLATRARLAADPAAFEKFKADGNVGAR